MSRSKTDNKYRSNGPFTLFAISIHIVCASEPHALRRFYFLTIVLCIVSFQKARVQCISWIENRSQWYFGGGAMSYCGSYCHRCRQTDDIIDFSCFLSWTSARRKLKRADRFKSNINYHLGARERIANTRQLLWILGKRRLRTIFYLYVFMYRQMVGILSSGTSRRWRDGAGIRLKSACFSLKTC